MANGFVQMVRGEWPAARLLRGGAGGLGVQILHRAITLALGILFARMLGAEGYGIYAFAVAVMSVLMVAAEAGVPTLLLREVAASIEMRRWDLLRGVIRWGGQLVLTASLAVSISGLVLIWLIRDTLEINEVITLAVVLMTLPWVSQVKSLGHLLRGLQHIVAGQALELLMRPAIALLLVAIVFSIQPEWRSPQVAMMAQLIAAMLVLAAGTWMLQRRLPPAARFVKPTYRHREWLGGSMRLALMGGAAIVNAHADVLVLGWFREADEVGVYRVASQGSVLVAFGLQAVNAAIAPQFARLHAAGEHRELQRVVSLGAVASFAMALPVAMVFIIYGETILGWVFGPPFAAGHLPLTILTAAQLLNTLMGCAGFLLLMTGAERETARAVWWTTLLNILLNLALIPAFGAVGAAIATAVSLLACSILLAYLVASRLRINSTIFVRRAHS